jgi:exodeoxyribonuclease VII large subunit
MTMLDAPPTDHTPDPPRRDILTVSRLNREAKLLLEQGLGTIWLEGEISNLTRAASGHWYFSLKDANAQVRCAMFRGANLRVRFAVRDGSQVIARGRVGLYEARGEFQFVAEHLEEAGEGALRRRFEELKQKLRQEGLFEPGIKKPLPLLPKRIGVITSPTGAAIRDVLHVLGRRFPAVPVLIYPVAVQGEAAPREIAQALALAGQRAECDVLIVGRGGGSLEDLWAFNEEIVARAIHACPIPIVSAVGHETDVTIADFVADERAPTPSAAAERVVPDRMEWLRRFRLLGTRLGNGMRRRIAELRIALALQQKGLQGGHPNNRLREHAQRLDELQSRLTAAMGLRQERARARLTQTRALLERASPALRLQALRQRLEVRCNALAQAGRHGLTLRRNRLQLAKRTLDAVSPLATLARGYAIVEDAQGHVVVDASTLKPGDQIEARLARGRVAARVERIADHPVDNPSDSGDMPT